MKRLVLMILMPFMLMSYDDLPYDYIDNSTPKITKKKAKRTAKKIKMQKIQKESDGFFLGIGGTLGKPLKGNNREITIATAYGLDTIYRFYSNYTATEIDGGIETMLGYKWFYGGGTFGIRYHFGYNARFLKLLHSHNFTLVNWDMLFNFVKIKNFKFGIILGFGYGLVYERINKEYCQYFKDCNIVAETIQGNFGVRFVLFNNYAIEFLAQPRYSGKIFANMSNGNNYNNYDYNYNNNQQKLGEFLSNKIDERIIMGTLRFVYAF